MRPINSTHFPSVLSDEEVKERSENERSDTRATHGDTSRQRSPFVEVEADHNNRR